jgi:hypothetical protein
VKKQSRKSKRQDRDISEFFRWYLTGGRRSRRKKNVVVTMMMTNGIKGEIRLAPLAGCYELESSGSITYEECPCQTSGC